MRAAVARVSSSWMGRHLRLCAAAHVGLSAQIGGKRHLALTHASPCLFMQQPHASCAHEKAHRCERGLRRQGEACVCARCCMPLICAHRPTCAAARRRKCLPIQVGETRATAARTASTLCIYFKNILVSQEKLYMIYIIFMIQPWQTVEYN